MFRQNAIFILGAGAGADLGMPLGYELASDIINRTTNPQDSEGIRLKYGDKWLPHGFTARAKELGLESSSYHQACNTLAKGLHLSPSIDEFLFAHSENKAVQSIGKLAIARCILHAERNCKLFYEEGRHKGINMSRLNDSWLLALFRLVQRRIKKGNESDVFRGFSIINFNYDRCVEFFLFHALQDFFGVSPKHAAEAMQKLQIFHPYGTIGPLPWQDKGHGIDFGRDPPDQYVLASASTAIKTFTEEIESADQLDMVRHVVSSGETLIFLGFHFHLQNLQLLDPAKSAQRIYATVYKRSADEQNIIRRRLNKFLKEDVQNIKTAVVLNPGDCATAFQEHALTWSTIVES